MATRLENWSYRKFKAALDAQYQEALENLYTEGVASVDWIKRNDIYNAYHAVWPTVGLYSANKTLKGMGRTMNVIDDIWKQSVSQYVDHVAGDRITEVWAESKKQYVKTVKNAVETATNEGLGTEATARRIEQLVNKDLKGNINRYRAKRIAQTETISAGNYGTWRGQMEAVEQGATIKRKWLVRYGAKHPRHATYPGLDGQVREVNQPFDVGGEQLMYPGAPNGSAENVINCHCVMQEIEG